MNNFAISFFLINSIAILLVPKRFVFLPILLGTCYMTQVQGIQVGSFSFTFIRMLIAVGIFRIIVRGDWSGYSFNRLDQIIIIWAIWLLLSSFFRADAMNALEFRLGQVFNVCGIYFIIRFYCQTLDDYLGLVKILSILLFPIALEMIQEHINNFNLFSILGGVPETPAIRYGNIRAQGPFRHPILAGVVGAVCLPMIVGIWSKFRSIAIIGIFSCLSIVICSSSSGPLASLIFGVCGMLMWNFREKMKFVRWIAVIGYIALDLFMKAPPYYLMGRIPLIAGSTGWHRAELINSAMRHLNEWWLFGTDFTRHWMPTGVSWSPDNTDITNHYIKMGVIGGLPAMLLFISSISIALIYVGKTLKISKFTLPSDHFLIWVLGVSLFTNAVTMVSVSYFDQSFVFLYLNLAIIGSIHSETIHKYNQRDRILKLLLQRRWDES